MHQKTISKNRQSGSVENKVTTKGMSLASRLRFSFLWCKNLATSVCGVYISQLIRYIRACISYYGFLDRGLLLTWKLLNQESKRRSWNHPFVNYTDAITSWFTEIGYPLQILFASQGLQSNPLLSTLGCLGQYLWIQCCPTYRFLKVMPIPNTLFLNKSEHVIYVSFD